jgi:hypothetical protein
MKMKKISIVTLLVLSLIAATLPPAAPYNLNGLLIGYPVGMKINAWMHDTPIAVATSVQCYDYGVCYWLSIPGAAENENEVITFKSGGVVIGSGVWHSGVNDYRDFVAPSRTPRVYVR